ncbi:hypothetical protein TNCV_897721 [Trichonephila clavipes]|nr:hypothetical protein TNCV_897721 [Trichonephila clavipes]
MSGLGTKRDRDKERKLEYGATKFLKKLKELYPTSTSTGGIEENLIGFLDATETIGEYLTNANTEKTTDIQNDRGQNNTTMVQIWLA